MKTGMFEYASGVRMWKLDSKIHREDGPAIIQPDGHKEWWVNGLRHRIDGPAIEWINGDKWWFLDDIGMPFETWLDNNPDMTDEEKIMFKLQYG
jgi:hypothetical protein